MEQKTEQLADLYNKYLSIPEISKLSGKSIKSIRREVASGNLNATKRGNKCIILYADYVNWNQKLNKDSAESISKVKKNVNKKKDDVNWIDVSQEMEQINAWKNPEQLKEMYFVDLFSGAGGLSCGLAMSGMKPIASIENMAAAVETYKYNFSERHHFEEEVSIKDIKEKMVKEQLINDLKGKHIHLVAGGFPCQGFSMAGNRIIADPRNSLYLDMLEIVKQIKPDFVLMENVEGLRSMLSGNVEKKIIADFEEIGYNINVTVLNAADYGTPQIRKRVIFIGNRIGLKNFHPSPIYNEDNYKTVGDALAKYLDMPEDKEINHIIAKTSPEMKKRLENIPIGKSLYANYSDAWKKVDWNKPSCTVKENHGGVNVHPILNRVMTPRELAALQSFPDDFIFKGSKKWQLVQIGNAVPCLLGKAIGHAIQKSYEGAINDELL